MAQLLRRNEGREGVTFLTQESKIHPVPDPVHWLYPCRLVILEKGEERAF